MNTSYLKNKVNSFEVYHTTSQALNAELTKNETDFVVEGTSETIAITVVKDKKIGFAYTNDIKKFKQTADKAIQMARANTADKDFKGFVKPQKIKKIKNFDNRLLNYSLSDFARLKKGFIKGMKSVNNKIMLSNGYYGKEIQKIRVINSEGVNLQDKSAINSFTYEFVLKHRNEIISLAGAKADIKPLTPGIFQEEAKRVLALANKQAVNTMQCNAVFHPEALASLIHKTLIPNINAENTQQKKSIFLNKLNKKIMSEKLTITDNATTKGLLATRSFDCEGTPSQNNTIIHKGTLKTFLYNNYTAKKEVKNSTGNAVRSGVSLPSVGANNIIINPGKEKNMIQAIKKGIYVRDLLGVHTMNALTGDFSLGVLEGFYIGDGKIKYALKNAMIAGNVYDMLNKIITISEEQIHAFTGNGAYYLPEISFENIKLIGQN